MIWWDEAPRRARWWYEDCAPRPLAGASTYGGDAMAMHRKYPGWSELRPAPSAPWWREVLEMVAGVGLTALALAGTAAAVLGLAMVLG